MDQSAPIVLDWLWQTTWQAGLLAIAIAIITRIFRRRLSPGAVSLLWMLVFIRLLMPVLPGSPVSAFALLQSEPSPIPIVRWAPSLPVNDQLTVPTLQLAPPTAQAPLADRSQLWFRILVAAWLLGASSLLANVIISTIRFSRRLNRATRPADSHTLAIVEGCCRQKNVTPPTILLTDIVSTPAIFGAIQPKLLLPPTILAQLNPDELRSVILHELEHIRRHHLLTDWFLTMVRAIHWFNPAAWWAHRQIRAARELICDQSVLATLDEENSRAYGLMMLAMASGLRPTPGGVPVAAFARDRNLLRQRIEAIASRRRYLAGLGLLLAATLGLVFLTKPAEAPAQNPPAPATRPTTRSFDGAAYEPKGSGPTNTFPQPGSARANLIERARGGDNDALNELLNLPLPEVRFDAIALSDVIEFLRDVSGTNISVDWAAVEAAGVKRDTPVSARLRDVKFGKALDLILDSAAGGAGKVGYTAENGVIKISTARAPATAPAVQAPDNQTVVELTRVVKELVAVGKFHEALGVIDRILMQEPENEFARNMRPLIDDRVVIEQQRENRRRFDARAAAAQNDPAVTQLERVLPEVRFDAVRFDNVIEFMRDVSGANIFVNWGALEAAGINRAAPITARLRDMKFSKALEVILNDAAGGAGKIGYVVDGGVITISAVEDLAGQLGAVRKQKVIDLIRTSNELISEQKYSESLVLIDEILTMDPKNEYALSVRPLIADRAVIQKQRALRQGLGPAIPPAQNNPAVAQLERVLPEVRFDAVAFGDVIDFLRDVSGTNIFVNWRALETAGIDRKAPVTARLRQVKFAEALETILTDVGGGAARLGYTVDQGVLTISTAEDLASNVVTHLYDIRDLLAGEGPNMPAEKWQELVNQIVVLIQDTVAQETWRDNGGNIGAIRELSGQLIVTQTPENQVQVYKLINRMRETRAIHALKTPGATNISATNAAAIQP